jgi:nucleotide-binding universal stress UspA family protein
MPATFVLGYDGSDCAKKALKHTTDLAARIEDAEVVVVYAFEFSVGYVPMGMTGSPLLMSSEYDQHIQLIRDFGDREVADATTAITAAGVKATPLVVEGRPVDVLLETAREKDADAIIVGSHGEGAVSAAFLGSTALKLLHHSDIPILVVPGRDKE